MKYTLVTDEHVLFQNSFYSGDVLIDPIITQNYRIIQAADSHYLSDFTISAHQQVCDVEITYIHYNEMNISSSGENAACKRGSAHIAFRGDMHGLSGSTSCRFLTVAFDVLEGSPMRELLDRLTAKYRDTCGHVPAAAELGRLMSDILLEFSVEEDGLGLYALDSLITGILLQLLRINKPSSASAVDNAEKLLPAMTSYIDRHALDIESLEEVANYLGYSYNHLYKLFRSHYRRSPKKYLTEQKMLRASEALEAGASISEISERLGFSTPYNFSRAFKAYFGVSPKNR